MKYWRALAAFRKTKVADRCECSVLTYTDIQECIDIVNHQYDENNMCKFQQDYCCGCSKLFINRLLYSLIKSNTWSFSVILALNDINNAIEGRDLKAMLRALRSPGLKIVEHLSSTDAELYFKHLHVCISHLHIPSIFSIAGRWHVLRNIRLHFTVVCLFSIFSTGWFNDIIPSLLLYISYCSILTYIDNVWITVRLCCLVFHIIYVNYFSLNTTLGVAFLLSFRFIYLLWNVFGHN